MSGWFDAGSSRQRRERAGRLEGGGCLGSKAVTRQDYVLSRHPEHSWGSVLIVKTILVVADVNWGRRVMAVGRAGEAAECGWLRLWIYDEQCRGRPDPRASSACTGRTPDRGGRRSWRRRPRHLRASTEDVAACGPPVRRRHGRHRWTE